MKTHTVCAGPLHVIAGSTKLSQSCLGPRQNNGLVSSLTGLSLLSIVLVSKTYAFSFSFVISWFLVVCTGGGTWHNKPFHFDFYALGLDLFSYSIWIFAWFSFFCIHFFSQKVWFDVPLFAQVIIALIVKLYFFVTTIKVNIETNPSLLNWKNMWAPS